MADTDTVPAPPEDLSLVALSPAEMPTAQAALVDWCGHKRAELTRELEDLHEHLLIATGNGWKLHGLQSAITRTEKRLVYYDKVKDAVEAGYLLIPNLPVTVLAVRVTRTKPPHASADWETSAAFNTRPELLPAGEGRYVDERLFASDQSYDTSDGKGGTKHVRHFVSAGYDTPDFPFAMVKPAVLARTEAAMALRLFDTIGTVDNSSGRDPIMVGQILDPRGNGRRATFFLAWWLDTRTL